MTPPSRRKLAAAASGGGDFGDSAGGSAGDAGSGCNGGDFAGGSHAAADDGDGEGADAAGGVAHDESIGQPEAEGLVGVAMAAHPVRLAHRDFFDGVYSPCVHVLPRWLLHRHLISTMLSLCLCVPDFPDDFLEEDV